MQSIKDFLLAERQRRKRLGIRTRRTPNCLHPYIATMMGAAR